MMKLPRNLFKIRMTGLFVLLLLAVIQVQSGKRRDHFILDEAYLQEYRVTEDPNEGYMPFFVECDLENQSASGCKPAIPRLSEKEGYVAFFSGHEYTIQYGCLLEKDNKTRYNQRYFDKAVELKEATKTIFPTYVTYAFIISAPKWFNEYVNIYKYRCASMVLPTIWKTADGKEGSYHIGYQVVQHNDIPLAHVVFDHKKVIPLRTKHTLYGASLAAPMGIFRSAEEIIYDDPDELVIRSLKTNLNSYNRFNVWLNNEKRNDFNIVLRSYKKNIIAHRSTISMAHLIPEYDMVMNSWQHVSRFAQTIAPMWTEFYLGVWASVEEMLREYSFMNEKILTVYSGTHGQLTLDQVKDEISSKFFLNEDTIPLSEYIWKLAIDETENTNGKQEAIAIILCNISKQLEHMKIFTPIPPPCESICGAYYWNKIDVENIYCCRVEDVRGIIEEFPDDVKSDDLQFDVLRYNIST